MVKFGVLPAILVVVISFTLGIDDLEQLGKCRPNFNYYGFYYIHENEGVWFPQYRTRTVGEEQYTCHTVYERMYYDAGKAELLMDSYFTKDKVPLKEPRMEDFTSGSSRGIMTSESMLLGNNVPGHGPLRAYNFVVKMTDEFRVRYICTDHSLADENRTTVYIETKKSHPPTNVIRSAVAELRKAGLFGSLHRIDQENCTRPTVQDGYIKYT